MYIIPTIEEKNDTQKPSRLINSEASGFIRLQPSIFTVQQYPLTELYGFSIELFSPFVVPISQWRLISIDSLNLVASLSTLSENTYYKKLNTIYPLLNTKDAILQITFVVFTDLIGLINNISTYTEKGAVLQEVNITGHIATFSSTVREFTLDNIVATKTDFPIPATLKFTLDIDLSTYNYFSVYNITSNIGQSDYVLYNNKLYRRSKSVVPVSGTFTSRSDGGLLWI